MPARTRSAAAVVASHSVRINSERPLACLLATSSLLAAAIFFSTSSARATTYAWDADANPANGATDGSGVWDLSGLNWFNAGTDIAWTNSSADIAAFGQGGGGVGGGGTVTLGTNLSAGGISFTGGDTGNFTVSGFGSPTLTLGSSGVVVNPGAAAETFDGNLAISLFTSQSWANNTSNLFTINSSVSAASASTLTIGGSGNTTVGGVLADGTHALEVTVNAAATSIVTLSAANTYTGATNVASGTLTLSAPGGLANTAITVAATASFSARPGRGVLAIGSSSNPSAGATIMLNPGGGAVNGGTFDMLDGAIGTVMLNQGANVATGLTLGTSGPLNPPVLALEIGDSGTTTAADQLFVTTGVLVGSGTGAEIRITPIGTNPLHAGTYPLITAGSFTNADRFSLATPVIAIGSNQYNLSLTNTGTIENLIVSLGGPPVAYWSGKQNNFWNALTPAPGGTNWLNAPAGSDAGALPSSGTNVYFTANSAAHLATMLGRDFAINSLTFTGAGTSATSSIKISGNTLTINASPASGNPAGNGILVQAGSGAHTIASNIALAASQTWTNFSTNPLTITGDVGDGGQNLSLSIAGAGPIVLGGNASYGGTTTVINGTLATTSTGTIGSGPLTVSSTGSSSVVNLGNVQSVGTLSGLVSSGGSASLNIGSGVALTVTQSSDATFPGAVNLASTAKLKKLGGNTLEVDGAMSLGDTSSILVAEGMLRLAPSTGLPTVSTGVVASISGSATLELAGSVSALSSGSHRVNITNTSNSTGLLVSGTNQQVGKIDGSGTTFVKAGSDLTANHIIQSALAIGGAAGSPALVMIDASDASGNPLGQSSGPALTGSLTPSSPFGVPDMSFAILSAVTTDSTDLVVPGTGNSVGIGNASQVPEPSTLLLALLAVLGVVSTQFARHHFRCQTV